MVQITEELIRKRAEHNDGEIGSLTELSLHQEAIEVISPLLQNACRNLEILLLQSNIISKIENLHKLKCLKYLNLAVNNIERVENLNKCESLEKLDLTLNFIGDIFSIESLKNNYNLRQLYLTGNQCTLYENYREFIVGTLTQLRELDGSEIVPTERIKALQQMNAKMIKELKKHVENNMKIRNEQRIKYLELKQVHDDDDAKFWNSVTENSPEVRTEIVLRSLKNRVERKLGGGDFDISNENVNKSKRKLFNGDNEPLNINEAQIDYHLDYEESNEIILTVKIFRYLDTSLLSYDIHPKHITIWIKGKVLQLKLPEEIQVGKTKAQRSQASGLLTITMPKLTQNTVLKKKPLENGKKKISNSIEDQLKRIQNENQRRELLEIGGKRTQIENWNI